MKPFPNHLLGALFLVVACAPAERGQDGEARASDPAGAGTSTLWTVSEDAIGPFRGDTPFDASTIASLAPGYEIDTATRSSEGLDYTVFLLRTANGSAPVAEVAEAFPPGTIGEVTLHAAGLVDNPRIDIGGRFADSGFSADDCLPGMEALSGLVVCTDPANPQLGYWFDPSPYAGPDGELPPAAVLEDATVTFLRWWKPVPG
ncbi:hypothetical protein [Hyphobacterium marinum]|uniref:Spondin domain-containing protein n=1 Tax=Hyphobacterium marinum TaxID=3116574 RepID=A0ABU7LWJ0_9PROT|nr:hypothetical protein [Hyphobacterium sp. Y6023]MEE2565928.1 hypothetical protein [Hyphobacterium sp. Y6023]